MKYRIKNPQVEQAVRGLFKTQEDFEKHFQLACHEYRADPMFVRLELIGDYAVTKAYCCATIDWKDIEKVVEYDPKKWNPYPQVKPPKKDIYRVEYRFDSGEVKKESVYFDGEVFVSSWLSMNGAVHTYFKPWDDEGDEE